MRLHRVDVALGDPFGTAVTERVYEPGVRS